VSDYPDIFKKLRKRGIIGFPAVIGGIAMLFGSLNIASAFFAGALGFFGCMLIFAGAGFIAEPIARLIAEPSRNLFFPGDHPDKPLPSYSILEAKRKRGEFEEVITDLQKIMEEHPEDSKPYVEMIDIVLHDLNDPARAKRIYRLGLSVLEKDEEREELKRLYSMISGELFTKEQGKQGSERG